MRKIVLTTLTTLMLVSMAAVAFAADGGVTSGFGLAAAGIALGIGLAATGGRGGRGRDRCRGGDLEGLLELLHELGELDEGHLLEGLKELVGAELRHDGRPFC